MNTLKLLAVMTLSHLSHLLRMPFQRTSCEMHQAGWFQKGFKSEKENKSSVGGLGWWVWWNETIGQNYGDTTLY